MYPAPFEYHRANSVEEAVSLLGRYEDEAKLIAGGQEPHTDEMGETAAAHRG